MMSSLPVLVLLQVLVFGMFVVVGNITFNKINLPFTLLQPPLLLSVVVSKKEEEGWSSTTPFCVYITVVCIVSIILISMLIMIIQKIMTKMKTKTNTNYNLFARVDLGFLIIGIPIGDDRFTKYKKLIQYKWRVQLIKKCNEYDSQYDEEVFVCNDWDDSDNDSDSNDSDDNNTTYKICTKPNQILLSLIYGMTVFVGGLLLEPIGIV